MVSQEMVPSTSPAGLHMDEAYLTIYSSSSFNVTVWSKSVQCYQCDLTRLATLPANSNVTVVKLTQFPWDLQATASNAAVLCRADSVQLVEYGRYGWNISDTNCSNIYALEEPPFPTFLPLLAVLGLLLCLQLLWRSATCCYHSEWLARLWPQSVPFSELQSDLGDPSAPLAAEPSMLRAQLSPIRRSRCRVASLDTFRGLCVTLMIFVNCGGGGFWFFRHAAWNGLTVADLVFPWFLWIMGTSMSLSLRDKLRSCVSRGTLLCGVLRRAAVLVALGVALNSTGHGKEAVVLWQLRLPGVLQRIGITFLIVASIEVLLTRPQSSFQYGRLLQVVDLINNWLQWLIVLLIVSAQLLITFLLEVPDCPTGYLGPGGAHNHSQQVNCTGGAAGYIDREVFGWNHLYQHPSCKTIYQTSVPYDPEGLLGTLTAVLMVYLGVQSAHIMMSFNYSSQRITRWLCWAAITGLLSGVLCNFSQNDGVVPINKNLMSVSFVLAVSCFAFVVQSVLYLVVDEKQWWTGAPFNYAGMNALLLYVGSEMTRRMFPWAWQPGYNTHWEHTLMDTWAASLWLLIAFILYRKKIFLSL